MLNLTAYCYFFVAKYFFFTYLKLNMLAMWMKIIDFPFFNLAVLKHARNPTTLYSK